MYLTHNRHKMRDMFQMLWTQQNTVFSRLEVPSTKTLSRALLFGDFFACHVGASILLPPHDCLTNSSDQPSHKKHPLPKPRLCVSLWSRPLYVVFLTIVGVWNLPVWEVPGAKNKLGHFYFVSICGLSGGATSWQLADPSGLPLYVGRFYWGFYKIWSNRPSTRPNLTGSSYGGGGIPRVL